MKPTFKLLIYFLCFFFGVFNLLFASVAKDHVPRKSIVEFSVLPENDAATNTINLQKAIDWASALGAELYVEPQSEPYAINGGIILRKNVSLVGAHGAPARGTKHPKRKGPVGSVFKIDDQNQVFITVETGSRITGIQFWYPNQATQNPKDIIPYPATIQVSQTENTEGVTLAYLSFYGEYLAMDFNASPQHPCESILVQHCYGYPMSGEFVRINYCYDIPRILHSHVNPANIRQLGYHLSNEVIDAVIKKGTFAFAIDHTDNAQLIDVFTFGTFGGAYLGAASYGQMTNFNFDCVQVGIHKLGDNNFNRNWQIAQGSIIANAGTTISAIHPIIIEGKDHTSLSNVEAFSGDNPVLTNSKQSQDFMLVKGKDKLSISLFGCRMRNYASDLPFQILNKNAVIQAVACIDKNEQAYNFQVPIK